MKIRFFVYGTLKKGGRFATKFDSKRLTIRQAVARGTLYNVAGSYPAAIFNVVDDELFGEIHEYEDEQSIYTAFDLIEGFVEKDYKDNLYNRKKILVLDDTGSYVSCHTYEYNKRVDGFSKIKSGFWEI